MKRIVLFIIVAVVSTANFIFSQTDVTPGDGTLSAAISAANSGDILVLTPGSEYTDGGTSFGTIANKSITIETSDESLPMPIVHLTNAPGTGTKSQYFILGDKGSLTLKGIEFTGETTMGNGTSTATDLISYVIPSGPIVPGNLVIEDCLVHNFANDIVDGASSSLFSNVTQDTLKIENCIMHDAGVTPLSGTSGSIVQFKYANGNYFECRNSTFYRINAYGLRFMGTNGSNTPPQGYIDHCTFNYVGGGKPFVDVELPQKTWVVTNSVFDNIQSVSQKNVYIKNASSTDPKQGTLSNLSLFQNTSGNQSGINDFRFVTATSIDSVTDPGFTDTSTVFTFAQGSPLLAFASDGGPVGDPRWNPKPTAVKDLKQIPVAFSLLQNYPNPFNPSTVINFSLTKSGMTNLTIYDMLGREVAKLINGNMSAGEHSVTFNAVKLPSGIYIYKLSQDQNSLIQKMILLK